MSFLDDWKEWSTPKKVISILAVCCIGLIIIGMITGGGSPDKNTSPINDGNNNVEQITGKQVKIIYDGEWSGAAGDVSSINSISGSGDETIDMPDDASLISANAQKKDGSSNELTIQILKDGKVVKESSTTAEYGVAQVSASV
ncbi:MAG: hypothetical protein KIG63_07375 [Methanobrevibacter sp.]|uniref:hypothetical protein n=1 Tax=Methanobrevibacter TaxID=2172 RepID=UPI0025DA9876|nr:MULTISPECIES: hypothetical protein [Methanobrevibacter]MBS7258252.1 hypothetical protein [Methanobrevibacter sp.]MCI7428597.1 hypothetical protein [Methanobrevibacter sp.]MDD6777143.1 hypothetical protein [Methanobacteriaceae archaeon]MDY3096172.1 hypothetical protein [Methanobrevibacter sp.]